ncbi:hypothetical protein Vadar_023107 [Vaccinium darrowii]|uniref:Uncharacterized protein n=1 Tax=Vaccinium darrowii TaxID=229202 RepID=A0ACB7X371_9ERIC|nr:hypothetical protein Vadar_023107 [Vaccinium darrowii]
MSHDGSRGSRGANVDPDAPSDDIGWKFGVMVEKNGRSRVKCKLCDKSNEWWVLMMQYLQESNAKQFDKRKQKEELKEQIRATQCDEEDEYDTFNLHSDDSDPEMSMARQESLRFQNEYEERERLKYQTGGQYHVGGSIGAGGGRVELGPPPGFERRSSSLCETDTSRMVRTTNKWTNLSSPAARLAEMEVDLQRSKGNKQANLSSKLLRTVKKKLGRAVSQFVIYTRLPINTVNSPWLEPMLDVAREVGKGTKLPSSYEVSKVYLPQEIDSIQKRIESLKPSWKQRGVSLMCDG